MIKGTLLCLTVALAVMLTVAIVPTATKKPDCKKDMFQCRSGRCIPNNWLCDNDSDCEDGDDEEEANCPSKLPNKCNPDSEYRCNPSSSPVHGRTLFHALPSTSLFTNMCIPKGWVCDGETDCIDGDDENNCQNNNVTCTKDQFQCQSYEGHSSTCIPISWQCDGTNDCANGQDEQNCTAANTKNQCDPAVEFQCSNGKCIYQGWRCDGDDDCADGYNGGPSSDEKDCRNTKPCDEATHFKCATVNFCIPQAWRCDGEADCPDRTDERNCTSYHLLHNVTCKDNEFKCASGSRCINKEFVCDGDFDCPDQSDEFNCKETNFKCQQGFKNCSNGICRPATDFCNGVKDCQDGSDELNCPVAAANFTHFCDPKADHVCPNETPQRCISYDVLCSSKDPNHDCLLSSVCNLNKAMGTCNSTDPYCECRDMYTRNGTVCSCPQGFEAKAGRCVDIDECATPGTCDQVCENWPGSYRCHCHHGYRLVREEKANVAKKCRAIGKDPLLLLSNRATIRQYDLSTNKYKPLVNRLESAVAMDYWHRNQTLIWSDVSKEKIMMCRMKQDVFLKDETNCIDDDSNTTLVANDVSTPDGLAVDWVHGLLFWTDTGLDKIYVLDLVARHRRVLIDQGLDEPRAIAVDPSAGLIFWTDWGSHARIERAGMDGQDRVEILSGNTIRWPNGLAVDILDQRIYWADAKMKMISSSDYYGKDIRTVLHSSEFLRHPFSLVVFEERLYYTDWDKEGVLSVNKFTGNDASILIGGVAGPMTVRVYHEQAQPNHTNKCEQHTCSHLCLPRAYLNAKESQMEKHDKSFQPYTCACPIGYLTDTNNKNLCVAEAFVGEAAGLGGNYNMSMLFFFVVASICALGLVGYIWRGRRARPFSALQFDNPIYRRTTEDPDALEFGASGGDNSLGAFPSDTNPPLLASRLVLNQPQVPAAASNDFYHPDNYAYDQPIVKGSNGGATRPSATD